MTAKKKLSVCIIAKDEELLAENCIENMRETADEIIVADIGSSGRTAETAGRCGAAVYRLDGEKGFGSVKNACMERASGDWVLFLQADETIPREDRAELRLLLHNPAAEGYLLYAEDLKKRRETCPAQFLRLLRNREDYRFCYRSFEYIPDEALYSILNGGVRVRRHGDSAGWQTEHRKRLLNEDIKEHPEDGYVRYLMGIELLNQRKYKQSAGFLDLARKAFSGGYLYTPHLYRCLGVCLLALGRYGEAKDVLSEGLWLFPHYTDLLVMLAGLHQQLGNKEQALNELEVCLGLRRVPNACVPEPEITVCETIKLRDDIKADKEILNELSQFHI